ncbi:hypothetical protein ACWNYO_00595 [Candidatus Vidania fulgoroideorum]
MRISINKKDLFFFWNIINYIPIRDIKNVVIKSEELKTLMFFENKNIKIEYNIKNNIKNKKFIIVFKHTILFKILKTIKSKNVNIFIKEQNIYYKNKDIKLFLISKKYKEIKRIKKKNVYIYVKTNEMKEALKMVYFVKNLSKDVYILIRKNYINIFSCDNFRLSYIKIKHKKNIYKKFYIKIEYLKILTKIFTKEYTKIYFKKKSILTMSKNFKIEFKINKRSEEFDYNSIMDIKFNKIAIFNQKDFFNAIKRAKILCKNKNKYINIKISNYITVSSNTLDREIFKEKIKNLTKKIINKQFCFNIDYILSFIKTFNNETISMFFNKKKKVVLFKILKNENYKYILMPIEKGLNI